MKQQLLFKILGAVSIALIAISIIDTYLEKDLDILMYIGISMFVILEVIKLFQKESPSKNPRRV